MTGGEGGARIRNAGDSAVLLELAALIAPDVNARALHIADTIQALGIPGVRDVVPAYRSVGVFFDPVRADRDVIHRALTESMRAAAVTEHRSIVDIPVLYGGEWGPDLPDVARTTGLSAEEVIARHVDRIYRVYMLGFLPGFPYMGLVDSSIAVPRKPTPRVRVPAGSVAVAGQQTGIYPRESPGGWQLIGRTPVTLFDDERERPSLLIPGDEVRFVPISETSWPSGALDRERANPREPASSRTIHIDRAGLLTTIQDSGRWGRQALGVPVAGPMDAGAYHLANALVGNAADAAALEVTISGPTITVDADVTVAVTGADLSASVGSARLEPNSCARCSAGSVLRFGERRRGARAYIAFDGGVDVPPVFGSRATHLPSGMGGLGGRSLRAGDRLALGTPLAPATPADPPRVVRDLPQGGARVRVLPGPQEELFPPLALERLRRSRFTITPDANRMGYRLSGAPLPVSTREMISDVALPGAIQVPPSGDPILLMVDRQTTGGYPQLAVVITADLSTVGQLAPGDWIEFELCSLDDALRALNAEKRIRSTRG